jgi:hypothetical protein
VDQQQPLKALDFPPACASYANQEELKETAGDKKGEAASAGETNTTASTNRDLMDEETSSEDW